jgi:hypothetical protein
MSCSCSENACRKTFAFLGWIVLAMAGVAIVSMLPEIKRYIKMSSM